MESVVRALLARDVTQLLSVVHWMKPLSVYGDTRGLYQERRWDGARLCLTRREDGTGLDYVFWHTIGKNKYGTMVRISNVPHS